MNEQNSEKVEDSERLSFLLNFFIIGRDGSVAVSSKLVTLLSLLKDDKDIKLTQKEYLTSLIDKAINKDKSARRPKEIKSLIKYEESCYCGRCCNSSCDNYGCPIDERE